ncbi:hypothetical protein ASPWEDRAFT_60022 [Aspergillus wentii DTO 134E9]|uniref:Zn(2)-C6 fungal-type domain-containing protein n=1 Tax=Aspergillus wentii DTO 134E9 TaxID=1073089 RepID=A0A1L9RLL3_ASPWE|nr:uncharacterized protein ASPWEDRAFT_60022 [Aspergillus wentii DTO 134E9]KAI9929718.1 hypothetical protein MW887_001194 [Aspergillus wentii]OJJ35826.1 hypothetical protein ASPWEDRAFT_60022 [Aspergillus wentii DTO 134E9]
MANNPSKPRSCHRCNQKKIRCDKTCPCQHCIQSDTDCIFPPPGRAPRQRKRPLKAELNARLRDLEQEVQRLNTADDDIVQSEQDEQIDPTRATINQEERQFGRLISGDRSSRYISHQALTSLGDQINELKDILDSSEDESDQEEYHSPFILGYHSLAESLSEYHPDSITSQQLWKVYEANVSPLLPIFHIPTLRMLMRKASTNSEHLDKVSEALVFAVYYSAVTSMKPDDCQSFLGHDKTSIVQHYRFATEQALSRADFVHARSIQILQAMLLFLNCIRDTELVWVMTGMIHRLAQRLGLHRDGSNFGLSPFETEIRRRLWWHIYLLDTVSTEYNAINMQIPPGGYDTRLPLNINDEEMCPDSAEITERVGFTSMTFFLIRCEITIMFRQLQQSPSPSLDEYETSLNDISAKLENRHLQFCNLSIPIQWASATIARIALARAWLIPHFSAIDTAIFQEKRDKLLITATEVVEFAYLLETNENTAQWSWFFEGFVQWHAFAFVLSELCVRPICPITERAWGVAQMAYAAWEGRMQNGMFWKPISKLMKKVTTMRGSGEDTTMMFNDILAEMGLALT